MAIEVCKKPECRMPHQGFHICVDLSYRAPGEAKVRRFAPRPKTRKDDNVPGSFNDMPNWGGTRTHSQKPPHWR